MQYRFTHYLVSMQLLRLAGLIDGFMDSNDSQAASTAILEMYLKI